MKKLFLFAITLVLVFSCSKDKKINRQLNGKWHATMFENIVVSPQIVYEFSFDKEQKGKGSGYSSITYPGFNSRSDFTYEIKDKKISILTKDASNLPMTTIYQVETYTKTKMTFMNVNNGRYTILRAVK